MEYTTNYHLPQWVESDRIMMGDFNEAMSNLEGGITTAQEAADAAQSAADNAQDSADMAQGTADTAKAIAEGLIVTGSYTGNGETLTVELGFRPRFLIITAQSAGNIGATAFLGYTAFSAGTQVSGVLSFGETGFTVTRMTQVYPATNDSGKSYSYIAFR